MYEAVIGREITINQESTGMSTGVSQELYDLLAQQNDRGMRAGDYEW